MLPTCSNSSSSATVRGPFTSNSLCSTPGLPIDYDNPRSTQDIGCFLTSSYSGHENRLQGILSLRLLEVIRLPCLMPLLPNIWFRWGPQDWTGHGNPSRSNVQERIWFKFAVETWEILRLRQFLFYHTECTILCRTCVRKNFVSLETLRCLLSYVIQMPLNLCVSSVWN